MSRELFNFNMMMAFIITYILPTSIMPEIIGLRIDVIFFILVIFFNLLYIIAVDQKMKYWELALLVFIALRVIFLKDFRAIVLFSIVIASRMTLAYSNNYKIMSEKKLKFVLMLSMIATMVYTVIFWGNFNRYAFTTYGEPNISSLSIFLLSVIIMKYYKRLGRLLMLFGFLTFSRSYMLAVFCFVFIPSMLNRPFTRRLYNTVTKNFFIVIVLISTLLVVLSSMFTSLYDQNLLMSSGAGLGRVLNILDYSNYLRFKVNTNLIELYISNPLKLLSGYETKEFIEQKILLSRSNGYYMTQIKPHNFFYSYLQSYGGFTVFIMYYISNIFKILISKRNFALYVSIITYVTFLGTGLNSYFLIVSTIALMINGKDENTWLMISR